MRILLALAFSLVAAAQALAQQPLSEEAQAEIRAVVTRQLDALKRDDAAGAYALAAPVFRARYGTADRFLAGLKADYAAIAGARSVTFQDIAFNAGRPVQKLLVVGPDGKAVFAYFSMERQANGAWRVANTAVTSLEGRGI